MYYHNEKDILQIFYLNSEIFLLLFYNKQYPFLVRPIQKIIGLIWLQSFEIYLNQGIYQGINLRILSLSDIQIFLYYLLLCLQFY